MTLISRDLAKRLGVALNEASWIDAKLEVEKATIKCAFEVLTVEKDGKVPDDTVVIVTFSPVGRIIASLRVGSYENKQQSVQQLLPSQLAKTLRTFKDHFIYGWEFINRGDKAIKDWSNKLSFDQKFESQNGFSNTIYLFQDEGITRQLNVRIWFDELSLHDRKGNPIDMELFLENGKRAWEKIFAGDNETRGFGIVPGD